MKKRLKKIFRKVTGGTRSRANSGQDAPSFVIGYSHAPEFPLIVGEAVAKLLDEIPSETHSDERRFLYLLFSIIWSGENDVVEIGPFLGGTTRAIALGMDNNKRASGDSLLYTFDRFRGYYDVSRLSEYLKPLVTSGVLKQSDLDGLGESAEFLEVFEKIHSGQNYCRRVRPIDHGVPDRPEDLGNGREYFALPDHVLTDAVFIDGCKSWFGTKYFMREISGAVRVGTLFIFQDYGWYTCFWLSAFVGTFKDHFELIGHVATTYVFVLKKPFDTEMIEARFPNSPDGFQKGKLTEIFAALMEDGYVRNDYYAVARLTLHHAAAQAYVGNKEEARAIINSLSTQPWAAGHEDLIAAALRSPTYSPDGPILL